jgi:hypothetical protein
MKKLVVLLMAVLVWTAVCRGVESFPLTWTPLPGWHKETIPFPLDFAKSIPFHGVEELRFAPGFGDPKAADYFTYAFVWLIDDKPELRDWKLPDYMRAYFAGLMADVNKEKHWKKTWPTHASRTAEPSPLILVDTWDAFHNGEPLHLQIRVSSLETHLAGKRLLYFEVSPRLGDEKIQRMLAGVRAQLQP